jgi:DNA-binding response OmpR family regulator
VEDEPNIRELVEMVLRHEDMQTVGVADGKRALLALADEPIDLVVLDWMLPDLDGMNLLRRIRAFSAMPVLMLTARDDLESKAEAIQQGADEFLVKPFRIELLVDTVARLLAARRDTCAPL